MTITLLVILYALGMVVVYSMQAMFDSTGTRNWGLQEYLVGIIWPIIVAALIYMYFTYKIRSNK